MATKGIVKGIVSNLVTVEVDGPVSQNEICYISVGGVKLMAEVIKVIGKDAFVQVFESTRGMRVGDEAEFEGHMLEVTLGLLTIFVSQNGNRLINGILSGFHQALYSISSFKRERHHDLVRLEVFIHFAQPVTCGHLITHFRQRFEVPQFIVIQCKCIFTTFQEHAVHFIQVILQTVVVTRQHTRPQCYFKHVPFKLGFVRRARRPSAK